MTKANPSAHPREGGDPGFTALALQVWIPAFAGMSGVGTIRALADAKEEHALILHHSLEPVSRLVEQIGNVDASERIGAGGRDLVTGRHGLQSLAHAKRRERAFEAL
jgi:hypothetical protein